MKLELAIIRKLLVGMVVLILPGVIDVHCRHARDIKVPGRRVVQDKWKRQRGGGKAGHEGQNKNNGIFKRAFAHNHQNTRNKRVEESNVILIYVRL